MNQPKSSSNNRFSIVTQGSLFSVPPPVLSPQQKGTKEKGKKKPNPYFLFCQERRTELHAQNPQTTSREITKQLAEEWKSLSDQQKQKYNEAYRNSSPKKQETMPNLGDQIYLQVVSTDGKVLAIPAYKIEKTTK